MGVVVVESPRRLSASDRVTFVERESCPTCDDTRLDTVWAGRFADEPVSGFLAQHHYAADVVAALGTERFRLVRCAACSLFFHARVLDESGLTRLYSEWIDGAQIERFEAEHAGGASAASRFEQGRQLFKHMLRLHGLAGCAWPFRLLDVGCGDGRALRVASALGFDARGVDPSVTRTARAEHDGVRVHPTIEDALAASEGRFDAATLMEVLEHVTSPRAVLDGIVRALRPGGVLLIEVPDASALDGPPSTFDEMRVVHPLEHVNAFTPKTLEAIARAAGLVPAPRMPAHATTGLKDVVRTELSRFVQRPSTSRYFIRP
ncbi:MAG: class I SAM-dependent methyltransferase [Myxococcota bacterium]|nr:class I SAM-dependent methyltransferase [Myxococcota bacterium]